MSQSPQPAMPDAIVVGDVIIHPSAAIAPGAILQAAPDSQIIIGAGVCIGTGAILQAYQGVIEVESRAIVGAGVLVVGTAKIGSHACIGAETTIYNASIDTTAEIPPRSIIGAPSRQRHSQTETTTPTDTVATELVEEAVPPETATAATPTASPQKSVVGQVYVNNLLLTLFPHRNSLKNERNGQ
ncbi:MAG: hypothetical protein ACFB4I_18090 [Cyanophyceae cyanobacterium]